VLTVPAPNLVWRAVRCKRRWLKSTNAPQYYETTYGLREIGDAVESAGFRDVDAEPIDHSFTLWGCGGPFRGEGHYATSNLARVLGRLAARVAPQTMAFAIMVTARTSRGDTA
jgi:hypothetical protein